MTQKKKTVKGKTSNYDADSIKTLEGTSAIRKRYGMYIGSGGEEGVLKLFYEALGNAIDEFQAGRAGHILIKVDERTSEIIVSDDGIGLPQQKIEECCTKLHSSGKFEGDYSTFSIGMHGVGLTVINALSEKLIMIVKRDGYRWKQTFSKGNVTSKLEKLEKLKPTDGTGTTVSFIPDISVLDDITVNIDRYINFLTLSSYMNSGLYFDFIGIDKEGKKISKKIISKNGLSDYMKLMDKKLLLNDSISISDTCEYDKIIKKKIKNKIVEENTGIKLYMECEILIQFSGNDTNIIKTFCNGLETIEGGSHETGFRMAVSEVLRKAVKESNVITKKDGNIDILPEDINEGIIALVNVKHSDALYNGQTKDKLDVEKMKWFVKKTVTDALIKWLNSHQAQAKIIYSRIVMAAKGRLAATRAKTAKKKQAEGTFSSLSSLSKLVLATGDDPKNKRMFIVEGENRLH